MRDAALHRLRSKLAAMNTPIALLLSRKGSAVYSVAATATVSDAVRVMNQHKVGSILVMSGGELSGIFTERDVLTRVIAAGRVPTTTAIAEVMTQNPVTVGPHATVEDVMTLISEKRCRHLPVLEEGGNRVIGMISIGDVLRWLVESHRAEADHLRTYVHGVYAT